MRPKGSKKRLEQRRRLAVALRKQGLSTRAVAARVKCAPGSVSRWSAMYEANGEAGLDPVPNAGSKSRLSQRQREQLARVLVRGAVREGFADDSWTLKRVALVIQRRFGVSYHVANVHKVLHRMGFSPQKPRLQARERDEEAVAAFRGHRWRRLKKKPTRKAIRSSSWTRAASCCNRSAFGRGRCAA
jgi:transposase